MSTLPTFALNHALGVQHCVLHVAEATLTALVDYVLMKWL